MISEATEALPPSGAKGGPFTRQAQGVADGVWGLALSPVAATLEAGSLVLGSVERAALGRHLAEPSRHIRPARSFFADQRLLPLSQASVHESHDWPARGGH